VIKNRLVMLPKSYYLQDDVVALSRDLLGKRLITCIDGIVTGGIIVETEAYRGPDDRASHAYGGRRTPRNEVMYAEGGVAYVYRCYGIHNLFNVVTYREDIPHAILIRAIEPTIGVEYMLRRRKLSTLSKRVAGGPGTLSEALGITLSHNRMSLNSDVIWIEEAPAFCDSKVIAGPRVGVDYAGADALLPWRFRAGQ
jgi:DNA-3-methyladenine glycosylase